MEDQIFFKEVKASHGEVNNEVSSLSLTFNKTAEKSDEQCGHRFSCVTH